MAQCSWKYAPGTIFTCKLVLKAIEMLLGTYIKYVGGGREGFFGGHEIF